MAKHRNRDSSPTGLTGVFQAWRGYIQRYTDRVTWSCAGRDIPDAIFWTTERANVGGLAVSACLAGGVASEEYGQLKNWKRGAYAGRADLFVRTGEGRQFAFEAKQCWVWIGPRCNADQRQWGRVIKTLRSATREADVRLPSELGVTRVGLVFLVPGVGQRGVNAKDLGQLWRHERKRAVEKGLARIVDETGCLVERSWLREPAFDPSGEIPCIYPGVVALALKGKSA